MKHYLFLLLLLLPFSSATALTPQTLSFMAINSERQNYKSVLPFISAIRFDDGSPKYLLRADGEYIYQNSTNVVSNYYFLDPSANIKNFTYNVAHFYKSNRPRFKVMLHYSGWLKGAVFSFGADSGHNSQKIKLKPAIFVGYTQAFRLNATSYIAFGAGAWFGGKIKETPCLDDYNRRYWCHNLTAWSDRPKQRNRLTQYVNITFTNRF